MNIKDYPSTIPKQEQYTAGDVAILYGISHRTACRMIDDGDLPGFKLPGGKRPARRVLHSSIVEHVKANPHYAFILDKIVTKEPQ